MTSLQRVHVLLGGLFFLLAACPKGDPAASPAHTKPTTTTTTTPSASASSPVQVRAISDAIQVSTQSQEHMSTYVTISVAARTDQDPTAAITAAFAEVKRLSHELSEWRDDSPVAAVNAAAGQKAVQVPEELFQVVQAAYQVSVVTDGAFDISFQALGGLWDFKALNPALPDPKEIARRVALVDYRQVQIDPAQHSIKLAKPGMQIGLGGIAKGYIVDRASRVLTAKGFTNHLVNAGGDIYASGTRGDRPWRLAVRNPSDRSYYATIDLQDRGLATSGNYERFFYIDGQRYHHILDPKTGMPTRGTSSVTVVAGSAQMADAYATAVFVMGKDRAQKIAKEQGLELLVFDEAYQTWTSPGMPALIQRIESTAQGDSTKPSATSLHHPE